MADTTDETPPDRRRPFFLTSVAAMTFVAGATYAAVCVTLVAMQLDETFDRAVSAIAAVAFLLAAFRFAIAGALLRLRPWVRRVEQVYSILWIFLGGAMLVLDQNSSPLPLLAGPALLFSIIKTVYFSRRASRDLFDASAAPAPTSLRWRIGTTGAGLVIIALFASLLFENGGGAISRGRMKRTMADVRNLSIAVEAYATDTNAYPTVRTVEELAPFLEPTYIRAMPRRDGWNNTLRYEARRGPDGALSTYRIASAGKRGEWERSDLWSYTQKATTTPESDIVYGDGEFLQYPEATAN